jgi:hypothetical protein
VNGEQRRRKGRWFSSKEQSSPLIFTVRMMVSGYVIYYVINLKNNESDEFLFPFPKIKLQVNFS